MAILGRFTHKIALYLVMIFDKTAITTLLFVHFCLKTELGVLGQNDGHFSRKGHHNFCRGHH